MRTIAERAGSLGRLVEQLLLGARAGADQLPVTNVPFDLAALLRATVVSFGPLSDKHQVVADVPADLPFAHGDSMATDIIVGQLLENCVQVLPAGGIVTVRARVTGPMIEVTVEDEGIGIAPGDHERIFERFVQGETGDRRRFGGVGHRPLHRAPPGRSPERNGRRPDPPGRRHDNAPHPPPRRHVVVSTAISAMA